MSYPRKDKPVVGAGVSIQQWAKERLGEEAKRRGVSPSAYMGQVLMDHAEGLPEGVYIDDRQQELPIMDARQRMHHLK